MKLIAVQPKFITKERVKISDFNLLYKTLKKTAQYLS